MVLKEKTQEAFDFIKNHGGSCTTAEIMNGLGLEKIASVTGRVKSTPYVLSEHTEHPQDKSR